MREIQHNVWKLEDRFTELKELVVSLFKQHFIKIAEVVYKLTDLRASMQSEHKLFLAENLDRLEKCTEYGQLFARLNPHWNYLSPQLLQHLARMFDQLSEAKEEMVDYEVRLREFRTRTLLVRFSEVESEFVKPEEGFTKMYDRFQRSTLLRMTLEDVENVRMRYGKQYKLRTFTLMLASMVKSESRPLTPTSKLSTSPGHRAATPTATTLSGDDPMFEGANGKVGLVPASIFMDAPPIVEADLDLDESSEFLRSAMKRGYVDTTLVKALVVGPAGVGKTSLLSLLLGRAPPETRSSTGCAERAVRVVRIGTESGSWSEISTREFQEMIAEAVPVLYQELRAKGKGIDKLAEVLSSLIAEEEDGVDGADGEDWEDGESGVRWVGGESGGRSKPAE